MHGGERKNAAKKFSSIGLASAIPGGPDVRRPGIAMLKHSGNRDDANTHAIPGQLSRSSAQGESKKITTLGNSPPFTLTGRLKRR
jgi:hypothetical protein